MLLLEIVKGIFKKNESTAPTPQKIISTAKSVLNVGGGSKLVQIPDHYEKWDHLLLDIDPTTDADVVMDARKLGTLDPQQFDAVYCHHNLEHYYAHDVVTVLSGFVHVLKSDGFVEIHVPNMRGVLKRFVESGMEIDDTLYQSLAGPISVLDVIYGLGRQIESSGVDFYAHKTGFTEASLMAALKRAGFPYVWIAESSDPFSLSALGFRQYPNAEQIALLSLAGT